MRKNERISLEITGLTHEGSGVGRHQGMAVFVPMTAPGDLVQVNIVQVRKQYAFGVVEAVLRPGGGRVENHCPVYRMCGGCALRHLSYGEELANKEDWVRQNLRRIGGISLEPEEIIPSPAVSRYRNKAQYPIRMVGGRVRAGFFAPRSHRLVPVEDCLLQPSFFAGIVREVVGFLEEKGIAPYQEESHSGLVRHLFIRHAEATGQTMVWLVLNGDALPGQEELRARLQKACPNLASFGVDCNRDRTNVILGGRSRTLYGADAITDEICGVRVQLSALSFYQVNRGAAELLYRRALDYANPSPGGLLLDLYCGAGAIGLSMAGAAGEVVGVEVVPQAVENAIQNAQANGIGNAAFLQGDAATAASLLHRQGKRPEVVVLDPPRKGVDQQVIQWVAAMGPKRVVYISCNSATLARDCARFAQEGYRATRLTAVDLFPRTAHVEAVALLERAAP